MSALLAAAGDPNQGALLSWLWQGFVALERIDFGETEPLGVVTPQARDGR